MSVYVNPDQWDGYPQARDRLLGVLEQVDDVLVATGDVHLSLAFEVARDPNDPVLYDPLTSRGSCAVELVAPSVSSAGDPAYDTGKPDNAVESLVVQGFDALRVPNPHLKHSDERNGYLLVDLTTERAEAEFWTVPTVLAPTDRQDLAAAYTVPRGRSQLLPRLPV
jgi:alkaline phosphatase D